MEQYAPLPHASGCRRSQPVPEKVVVVVPDEVWPPALAEVVAPPDPPLPVVNVVLHPAAAAPPSIPPNTPRNPPGLVMSRPPNPKETSVEYRPMVTAGASGARLHGRGRAPRRPRGTGLASLSPRLAGVPPGASRH